MQIRESKLHVGGVFERVKMLEERRINLKLLGLGVMAIVRLHTSHVHINHCLSSFKKYSTLLTSHRVTGEDIFVLNVVVSAIELLEEVVGTD